VRNGERPAETTTNGRFTNSNEQPDSGWNRCVTRTKSGCFLPPASRAVDGSVEQRIRARHPHGQSTATKHGLHFFDALIMLTEGQPWMPAATQSHPITGT